jgi:hypothetical protein
VPAQAEGLGATRGAVDEDAAGGDGVAGATEGELSQLAAGLDEGIPALLLSNLVCMENPYRCNAFQ